MAVRIQSLVTSGPLVVPLSSGRSLRLSPGGPSVEVPDVEVEHNAKVDKLRARRLLDVVPVDDQADEQEQQSAAAEAPKRRRSTPKEES